jgi:hypothetical protein
MLQFITVILLMGALACIGMYWAIIPEHFLEWTTVSNLKFRKSIDSHLAHKPTLVERSYASFRKMQTNGTMDTFMWSVRSLGVVLAFLSIFTLSFIFSSVL